MQEVGQLLHVLVDVAVAVQEDVQPGGGIRLKGVGNVWKTIIQSFFPHLVILASPPRPEICLSRILSNSTKLEILVLVGLAAMSAASRLLGTRCSSLSLVRESRASWEATMYSTNTSSSSGTLVSSFLVLRMLRIGFFSILVDRLSSVRNWLEKGKLRLVMCLPEMSWWKKEQVVERFSRFETSRKRTRCSSTARGRWRRFLEGTLTRPREGSLMKLRRTRGFLGVRKQSSRSLKERAGFLFLVEILRERRLSREDLEGDIWRASSEIGQVKVSKEMIEGTRKL